MPIKAAPIDSARPEAVLEVSRCTRQEDVGAQSADVVPESLDGAVGGDEQIQDVETLLRLVGDQSGINAAVPPDEVRGLRRVPRMTRDKRNTVGSGRSGNGQEAVPGSPGEGAARSGDVHDPVALDALQCQER